VDPEQDGPRENREAMIQGFRSPRAKAMLVLGLAGASVVLVFWLGATAGLFEHGWARVVPVIVVIVALVVAYKQADRILDRR
jgi:peptidoglycan/LPS O-acetylase OafA/YrhL